MKYFFSEEKNSLIAPFFITLFVFFVPISTTAKSILLVLSCVALLITPYYRKHIGSAYNTLWGRAAVIFFLYIILASLWSDAPISMRLSVIDKYSKLIYLPLLAVGFIHPKTRQWAFNGYIAAMLITCILSFLKQKNLLLFKDDDVGAIFSNHIITGFMVSIAVYLAACVYFQTSINKWQRAYCFLMMVFGSYQVFFLNTGRTGYFIYTILMSLLIIQKFSFKKAMLVMILFSSCIGTIYILSPVMQARTQDLISEVKYLQQNIEYTSLGFRVQFHKYARSLFEQHPIIGIGTGSFKYRFSQDQPIPMWSVKLNEPHSQYWFTLTEQGLIGIMLLIIFFATLFFTALKLQETKPMLLGILIAFCIGSITDTIFCYSTAGTLLIILCAACFGELIEKNFCDSLNVGNQTSS